MKNSLKVTGLALIMWFGVASTANATIYDVEFDPNPFGWGALFGHTSIVGDFDDNFSFSLPSPTLGQDVGIQAASGWGPSSAADNIVFTAFELLKNGSVIASGDNVPSNFSNFLFTDVASTDVYTLHVMGGLANGAKHGNYAGTVTVSPIPEPETYAMLLVGLGLLGFAARRRSNTTI